MSLISSVTVRRLQSSLSVARRYSWYRCQHTVPVSQAPAPEIYTQPPVQPKEKKPGQLSELQLKSFFDKGFIVIPKFFSHEELDNVKEGVKECVDILAERLYKGGKIKDKCENAGFYKRLTLLEKQFKGATILLIKTGYLPPAFRELWSNERLLNVVEQLIGPDIAGHPVWNLRCKIPHNEQTTVPWHQDNAYLDHSALYTLMPTAWIPLIDANRTNGCMQVISDGHKPGFTATHTCCAGGTWYVEVEEEEMEKSLGANMERDVVTCEVPYGGMLLLNNCIPHRSLENYSDDVRWSMDLRWQDPKKSVGFYGLKDCVTMRKADDPNYKIDWEEFAILDRNKLQTESTASTELVGDEFDTSVQGPWMNRWDIVHHNRHTAHIRDLQMTPNQTVP